MRSSSDRPANRHSVHNSILRGEIFVLEYRDIGGEKEEGSRGRGRRGVEGRDRARGGGGGE